MTEKPIIFSAPMVRAILDGRKTQTRRLVGLSYLKPSETPGYDWTWRGQAPIRSIAQQRRQPRGCWQDVRHDALLKLCPYGAVGDRLWVRETWAVGKVFDRTRPAEIPTVERDIHVWWQAEGDAEGPKRGRWRPSIHMPRWASRITLEVTAVRVERLQAITDDDIRAEGVTLELAEERTGVRPRDLRHAWELGWDSINGDRGSWASNPWVWVITSRRLVGT